MGRDGWIVFAAKAVRTFCYGYLGVLYPIYLTRLGLDARELGVAIALPLLASAVFTLAVRKPAERHGPRPILMVLSGLIAVSAAALILSRAPAVVVLAAMIGNIAVGTGETGPFLTLEQVMLSRMSSRERMTEFYSFYNLVGFMAAALGAMAVACEVLKPDGFFRIFLAGGLLSGLLYAQMPVYRRNRPRPHVAPLYSPFVKRIALLFALDSFAGGFIIQSLVLYWFHIRFQMDLSTLGWVAFGTQLITGMSYLLTGSLSKRFGIINAMVFSHLISNVILVAIAFAPTPGLAVGLLWARHTLSQIDVPTRQAFLMLAVEDHEREAAASLTNTSRALAQALSPALTGWTMQVLALSAPFAIGGGLKIAYDLLLYATIRKSGFGGQEGKEVESYTGGTYGN